VDLNGKLIVDRKIEFLRKGQNIIPLNYTNVNTGMYSTKLIANGQKVFKFIKEKEIMLSEAIIENWLKIVYY